MKLLICTQAVDSKDPVLGFFVRWIEEFAKHCEQVTVICLRKGEYSLPANVRVFPLGGENKLSRGYKLLRGAWRFRDNYDTTLIHMNPEYLVAAGWLWRVLGKKTALWYTHKNVDFKLRIAVLFAQVIFTASKESFRLRSKKVQVVGHGIDTDFFSPDANSPRGDTILSAGRLSASKRNDLIVRAMPFVPQDLWIAGDGPEADTLQDLARKLQVAGRVHFLGAKTQSELRELYRKAGVFAHTSETGSLDKVVLEALLCGLPTVTTSEAYKALLEPFGLYAGDTSPTLLAGAIRNAVGADVTPLTQKVREEHSLATLIPKLIAKLA